MNDLATRALSETQEAVDHGLPAKVAIQRNADDLGPVFLQVITAIPIEGTRLSSITRRLKPIFDHHPDLLQPILETLVEQDWIRIWPPRYWRNPDKKIGAPWVAEL